MPRRPADGLGTQLRRLVELLDGDLDEIYAADGLGYRSRYSPIMRALHDGVPRTIKEVAALSSVSHSAASQTISRMMVEGLVAQRVGADARERLVHLTRKGRRLIPTLEARWRAADIRGRGSGEGAGREASIRAGAGDWPARGASVQVADSGCGSQTEKHQGAADEHKNKETQLTKPQLSTLFICVFLRSSAAKPTAIP